MGFRTGSYAKVWEVEPKSDTNTSVRLSISRKNNGEYEQDFSGYVSFFGTATAKKAACLKAGDRIKLGDVDVTARYNSDTKTTRTNFKCFSFEVADSSPATAASSDPQPVVDSGEVDDSRLPF